MLFVVYVAKYVESFTNLVKSDLCPVVFYLRCLTPLFGHQVANPRLAEKWPLKCCVFLCVGVRVHMCMSVLHACASGTACRDSSVYN